MRRLPMRGNNAQALAGNVAHPPRDQASLFVRPKPHPLPRKRCAYNTRFHPFCGCSNFTPDSSEVPLANRLTVLIQLRSSSSAPHSRPGFLWRWLSHSSGSPLRPRYPPLLLCVSFAPNAFPPLTTTSSNLSRLRHRRCHHARRFLSPHRGQLPIRHSTPHPLHRPKAVPLQPPVAGHNLYSKKH